MQQALAASSTSSSPESRARAFLEHFWDGQLPIDPVRIATAAGVTVFARGTADDAPYPFSGYYRRVGQQHHLEFNASEAPVRQRFTVAHELGHYALGHEDSPRDAGNFYANKDPCERMANRFAAELIMPASVVQRHYNSGNVTVESLAQLFGVSKDAMGFRLINLGLV